MVVDKPGKPRARDLGIGFDGDPGPFNAITDVAGIEVGQCTLIHGDGPLTVGGGPVRTGVTAILPRGRSAQPAPVWAGYDAFNGNGEMTGTHWIDTAGYFSGPVCITNTHAVGMAHQGAVAWMIEHYGSVFQADHEWAMPVVAETYDGVTNDICGLHVREEHVWQAIQNAASGPVAEGNTGGGTGMICYEFKGGTGTASRRVRVGSSAYTLGVLAQANFGRRDELSILGVPVGRLMPENAVLSQLRMRDQGSIIAVIATDAPMLPVQLRRLAKRAALGIGRTGTTGSHTSGDISLAFSTANAIEMPPRRSHQPDAFALEFVNDAHINVLYAAAVGATEEAIVNAMLAAEPMTTVKPPGHIIDAIDADRLCELLGRHGRAHRRSGGRHGPG